MDYYSFIRIRRDRRLSWPGWLTHIGQLTHEVVTRQPEIRHLSGKVCQSEPTFKPLSHAVVVVIVVVIIIIIIIIMIFSRNPRDKKAKRVVPHKRKEARRSNTRPMAERQVFMLGRDGHMPSGRIIRHWVSPRGRCCSGTRRVSLRGKICQHWKRIPLCAHRGRIFETLGPMNTSACQLFANPGRKISSASGDDREGAFLFCRDFRCLRNVRTLSCYMIPCQPLAAWTDDLHPIFYYHNFNHPREHMYLAKKLQ